MGLFVYLIRYHGNYPDGVAFAILLSNICVPLIDHYTRPRVSGYPIKEKKIMGTVKSHRVTAYC